MRYLALAFAATALAACGGGGDDKGADSAGMGADSMAMAPAPGAATTPAAGAAAPAPATGTTHTINMIQDAQGNYRFDPANMTVKQGDAIKFVAVSGMPHNVAFEEATLPPGAAAQLTANIPNAAGALMSEMLLNANQEVTISFAGVPAGAYNYNCTPHLAMNMKGVITVQ